MHRDDWAEQELIDLERKLEKDTDREPRRPDEEFAAAAEVEARFERDREEREADLDGTFDHLADLRDGDA